MASREARRKDGIEAVAIVTPNHLHYPIARERSAEVVFPSLHDGHRGVAFVEACIASSKRNGAWQKL